ncbi:MAG: AAA family ATPase [Clostridia bacterium]|nr:AAA family ATPase [Clostridia bacterium]
MILKSLHIISFGGLRNRDIDLSGGVNVIDGANESGKSSAAMFIKFIFYGLSAKGSKNGPTERQRYINRETMQASGFIIAENSRGQVYRLERTLLASDDGPLRERIRIINQATGDTVSGQNPGEYFFGVPEEVFTGTCFVAQASAVKPTVSSISKPTLGTNSAVENLLTSADENLDIAKAVKKLDNVRRELLYKNGSGGEIAELKKKRAELQNEMESSRDRAADIISASTSLDDIKTRIASLEEQKEHYSKLFAALDKITVKRRIDAAQQTRDKIGALESALIDMDNSPIGVDFEESLLEAERDIRAYDEECIAYDERMPELDGTAVDLPSGEEIVEYIHSVAASAHLRLGIFIGMIFAMLLSVGAIVAMYFLNFNAYIIPLGLGAVAFVLWIVFLILMTKKRRQLRTLLDEWDAESVDEIEIAVQDKLEILRRSTEVAQERERLIESLGTAKLRFDAAEEQINNMAYAANVEIYDDIYDTIDALHGVAGALREERVRIASKIENLTGRLEVLTEQLSGVDVTTAELDAHAVMNTEYGKMAAELDTDGIKNALRERDFTDGALNANYKRRSALEEKLTEVGRLAHTPDQLATLISAADKRIEELTLRHDAIELTKSAILGAGESMRSGVIPKISEAASRIISGATEKYNKLTIDSAFSCGLSNENDTVTSEYLSHGTGDLAYIALRIVLADEVFRGEKPTIIFDESFAHIDSSRIRNVMRILSVASSNQYIVFTCRADETNAAKTLGCNTIKL